MSFDLRDIFNKFQTGSDFVSGRAFGSGNINDTFLVESARHNKSRRFFLQRINHVVFSHPAEVMANAIRVTNHISSKLCATGVADNSRRVLNYCQTGDGDKYYRDRNGYFWRLCDSIEGARTYDRFTSPVQAYYAAAAFGEFQLILADFDSGLLHEVIPGFLDGQLRYRQLCQAVDEDCVGRVALVKAEIDKIVNNSQIFDVLPSLLNKGELPLRITHNDTKINNVLLDDVTGEGVCVIDLDTVMPGLVHYDFGDLVRSVLSTSTDSDLLFRHGKIDMEMFRAVVDGYLSKVSGILTDREKEYLVFSAGLMALMLATRFLTDYIQGDRYFRTNSSEHNLTRCRSQLQLFELLESNRWEMLEIVHGIKNM